MKRLIFTLIGIVLGLTGLKAVTFTPIEINDPSESVTIKLQPGANYLQLKAIESNTIHFNVGYFGIMMFECNAMGEEGLLTFTFTDELNTDKSKVTVDLAYGDSEAGSMGSFNPDFTIEGKTVVVDIRGYRFPETVETSRNGEVQTVITMNIKGLTTADGRAILTNNASAGTSGIVVTYPLKKQEISFYYDFLPTEGSSLSGCSEIIIWLPEEVGVLTFDKVLLQWLNNRGTLQTKEFKAEEVPFAYDESYAGYVSHIPLAGVSKDREVTLTVEGGMLSNGDSVEITGKFNTDPTGIDSVLGDDANAVVKLYTIDGILVKEAPAATVLTGVKKGVYIMNGKKVVVK